MAEIIFISLILVLAVFGLAEVIHNVKLWILSPIKENNTFLVAVPDDNTYSEYILNLSQSRAWHGKRLAKKVIFIKDKLKAENREACDLSAVKLDGVACFFENLADNIKKSCS